MRLRRPLVFAFACLLFLSGCADRYWYQPGVSLEEVSQDCRGCYSITKNLENWLEAVEHHNACMKHMDYRLVPESELPSRIKKNTFQFNMYWEELVAGQ